MKFIDNIGEKTYFKILLKFHQELFNCPIKNAYSAQRIMVSAFGSEYFVLYNGNNTKRDAERLVMDEVICMFPNHLYPSQKIVFLQKISDGRLWAHAKTFKRTAILAVLDDDTDFLQTHILPFLLDICRADFVNTLIECAIDFEKTEITVMLLDYKHKNNLYETQEELMKRLEL